VIGVVLAIALGVILRSAWVAEDAFITLRTSDNFVHGLGLTWNPEARVQAYTHPLWMFLLTFVYWIVREPYFTALGLALVVTTGFLGLFVFVNRARPRATILALLGLIVSKAFIDYSTSGLENPLTHLLILLGYTLYWDGGRDLGNLRRVSFVAALAGTNRLDSLVFFLPILVAMAWQFRKGRLARLAVRPVLEGFSPLILWSAFSLFYYGSLVPNTAYAKLNTGIPLAEYVEQGGYYLFVTAYADPLTAIFILTALGLCCLPRFRKLAPAGIALALWFLYLLKIGGDFMIGRMLAAPTVLSCMVIARIQIASPRRGWILAALVLIAGFLPHLSPLRAGPDYGPWLTRPFLPMRYKGVRDTRAKTYPFTGLLRAKRDQIVDHPWAQNGRDLRAEQRTLPPGERVHLGRAVGMLGFYAGPRARIIDEFALADPLLARLPIPDLSSWRIGHFLRELPAGYEETWRAGENRIEDPDLAAFYDHLTLIVSGDLRDPARLLTILKLQIGSYDHLVEAYLARR